MGYLEDFQESASRILSAEDDKNLVVEYEVIQGILDVPSVETSLLMEQVDILNQCVLEECSKRFVSFIKDKSKIVSLSLVRCDR